MRRKLSLEEQHDNQEILKGIVLTKHELDILRQNYEFAESDLIDYYLYQLKAHQARMNYLVKAAKKRNLHLNVIEKMELDEII